MGISGLLPLLKSITRDVHVSDFAGQTAAIDTYGWLHRGAYGCSVEICRNEETTAYVDYCIRRIEILRYHKIVPIMVLDGANLPMKARTEMSRHSNRKANLEKGHSLFEKGDHTASHAYFSRAVDVTFEMVQKLLKKLREMGVKYVVAPYEADAQLAYLVRYGQADFVISEDSDCIPFGCNKVLFKMNNEGYGQVIDLQDLGENREICLKNFTSSMILDMCILSGCDYLASVNGMGVKSAYKLVSKYKDTSRILKGLRFDGKYKVPNGYEDDFRKARLTFLHQIVYPYDQWNDMDPKATVHLVPLEESQFEIKMLRDPQDHVCLFLGEIKNAQEAHAYATGKMDPTKVVSCEEETEKKDEQDEPSTVSACEPEKQPRQPLLDLTVSPVRQITPPTCVPKKINSSVQMQDVNNRPRKRLQISMPTKIRQTTLFEMFAYQQPDIRK